MRKALGWVIAGGAVCFALVLAGYGFSLLGFGGDAGQSGGANTVVVIASRTPDVVPSDTPIPLPTDTPRPSDTPDPVIALGEVADGVIIGEIEEVILNMGALVIRYAMGQDFNGYNVGYAEDEMVMLACALRDAGYADINYQFHALVNFRDASGNVTAGDGLVVRLLPEAIQSINCPNYPLVDLRAIAEFYELAEGLR